MQGETKMNRSFVPSNSNSTDPMLRLNGFIRAKCQLERIAGSCKITEIAPDPEHLSLAIVKFSFNGKEES